MNPKLNYKPKYSLIALVDEELVVIIRDLLIGGAETDVSLLEFAILHLTLNPSVQEGLREEIGRVTGCSIRPV